MADKELSEIYWDGRHYDLINADVDKDIEFYKRLGRKYGSPVLELACGTGRVTIPLAEAGFDIVGLDISEPMLDFARKKAKARNLKIEFVNADCRNFNLSRKFKTIIFPFNAIAHLYDRKDIDACFSCVRKHLHEDGIFSIDIFNPSLKILMREPQKRFFVGEYEDPDNLGKVAITETNFYDDATQINHVKWYFSVRGKEVVRGFKMRMFFPKELDELLFYNGFK